MRIGPSEAVKLFEVSRAKLDRDSRKGVVTSHLNTNGYREYDVAELERVYKARPEIETGETVPNETERDKSRYVEVEIEFIRLREKLAARERENVDLREGLADWKEQATAQTRLLTDQRADAAKREVETQLKLDQIEAGRRQIEQERTALIERAAKAEAGHYTAQAEAERLQHELEEARKPKGFLSRLFGG